MTPVELCLGAPPRVVNLGVGVHGVTSDRDVFRLPDLWQLHVYGYVADLTVDAAGYAVRPGRVSVIPPGRRVEYHYRGRSEHLYAHFALADDGEPTRVPLIQDMGAEAPVLTDLVNRAVAAAPHSPARVSAEVWAALWRVADLGRRGTAGQPHACVEAAVAHIECRLHEVLTVPEVARAAGVSHNHLIRLFHAHFDTTVVAYIRSRRMARARHLLRESTLSISAIAAAVGMADLQAFNKACRRELGASPRAVRAGDPHDGGELGARTS
ncbi:helix-turn-helix transcriptional regulator [Streptomyces sp. NA04227]|uniref:helix-turn-helix domain-containing protein n=1 Tax=Streptomyces sp. NA04227 TaxID=2742136 RepID=UPI001592A9FB|nr:helix-turn-helix transcriptional regulator [Streptomyces sp. NA04227]QKW10447.1 helix-turn-helix transcriptional regulator [Streptomyces sp. NA04227]